VLFCGKVVTRGHPVFFKDIAFRFRAGIMLSIPFPLTIFASFPPFVVVSLSFPHYKKVLPQADPGRLVAPLLTTPPSPFPTPRYRYFFPSIFFPTTIGPLIGGSVNDRKLRPSELLRFFSSPSPGTFHGRNPSSPRAFLHGSGVGRHCRVKRQFPFFPQLF